MNLIVLLLCFTAAYYGTNYVFDMMEVAWEHNICDEMTEWIGRVVESAKIKDRGEPILMLKTVEPPFFYMSKLVASATMFLNNTVDLVMVFDPMSSKEFIIEFHITNITAANKILITRRTQCMITIDPPILKYVPPIQATM